jgi:transposase
MVVKAYSDDLRRRIIAAKEKGQSGAVVARRYQVTVRSVERYWKRYQETAQIAPRRQGGYRRSKLAPHDRELVRWIEQQPDLTLAELQQRCDERLKVTVSLHALWYRLDRIGLSRKKNDARRRARPA